MSGTDRGARWLLAGRVQGVGFRWFTVRTAQRLGLRGSVRNLPDGRVEVLAAGPPETLRALDDALRAGPGMARVDNVEKVDVPPQEIRSNTFEVG